jgi:hypothetical protein
MNLENYNSHVEAKISEERFVDCKSNGFNSEKAIDLFVDWFDKLNLAGNKIEPISHNWPQDRIFLQKWLGTLHFEHMFSPRYRDTQVLGSYANDRTEMSAMADIVTHPYNNLTLNQMCILNKIPKYGHKSTMTDAYNTACLYKSLVYNNLNVEKIDYNSIFDGRVGFDSEPYDFNQLIDNLGTEEPKPSEPTASSDT